MTRGSVKLTPELMISFLKIFHEPRPFTIKLIKNAIPADAVLREVYKDFRGDMVLEFESETLEEPGEQPSPMFEQRCVPEIGPNVDGTFTLSPEAYAELKQMILRSNPTIVTPNGGCELIRKFTEVIYKTQGIDFEVWT